MLSSPPHLVSSGSWTRPHRCSAFRRTGSWATPGPRRPKGAKGPPLGDHRSLTGVRRSAGRVAPHGGPFPPGSAPPQGYPTPLSLRGGVRGPPAAIEGAHGKQPQRTPFCRSLMAYQILAYAPSPPPPPTCPLFFWNTNF